MTVLSCSVACSLYISSCATDILLLCYCVCGLYCNYDPFLYDFNCIQTLSTESFESTDAFVFHCVDYLLLGIPLLIEFVTYI